MKKFIDYLKILNREELALGVAFGASMVFLVGPIRAGALAIACGFLWAVGGSGKGRAFRYVGVPLMAFAALASVGVSFSMDALAAVIAGAVLSLGYGIPDGTDQGSPIGRFFYYGVAKMRQDVASLYTRGFLALALGAAYLPVQGVNLSWAGFLFALVVLHLIVVKWVE